MSTDFAKAYAKYSKTASPELLAKTVKALEAKKHIVKVVKNEKEAQEYLQSLIPDGSSVSMGGSTTLDQIGFVEEIKKRDDKITNYKGKAVAAMMTGDMATYGKLVHQGYLADTFLSSCSAISADGDLFVVDMTGSRWGGWASAGKLVVVTGSNKLVENEAEAEARIQYQYQLESARVRVAYKIPASQISNKVVMKNVNPMAPPRVHVVIIEKSLGF